MLFDAPRLALQNSIFGFSISNSSSYSAERLKHRGQNFWYTLSIVFDVSQCGLFDECVYELENNKTSNELFRSKVEEGRWY